MSRMQVWKYQIPESFSFRLEMPAGAVPVHVDVQHGGVCIWAVVDPSASKESREFFVVGTGHDIPDGIDCDDHVGTFLTSGGALVFHIFQVRS